MATTVSTQRGPVRPPGGGRAGAATCGCGKGLEPGLLLSGGGRAGSLALPGYAGRPAGRPEGSGGVPTSGRGGTDVPTLREA